MWQFSKHRDNGCTISFVWYALGDIVSLLVSYLSECGVLERLYMLGFATTFLKADEISSTLSFYFNAFTRSWKEECEML